MQSLTLYTSCLYSMSLYDDIVDIEKPDEICSLNNNDNFSGIFLHKSVFYIKDSRSAWIIKGTLSEIWYWLNCNILVSSEGKTILQILNFHMWFKNECVLNK